MKKALCILLLFVPCNALAITLQPQSESGSDSGSFTVTDSSQLEVKLAAGHSYSCSLVLGFDDEHTAIGFSSSVRFQAGNLSFPSDFGRLNGFTGQMEPRIDGGSTVNRRLTVTPGTQIGENNLFYRFGIIDADSGGQTVKVACYDATLYGGYNTSIDDFNFLELENLADDEVNFSVLILSNSGALLDSIDGVVAPAGRTDIDIHSVVGQGVYGSIRVLHNAPRGALQGRTSLYRGTVESFLRDGTIPLQYRDLQP